MPATIPSHSPLWVPGQKPRVQDGTALAIDWGHPLARGLTGLWLMNETNPARAMNLVNGAVPTTATSVTTTRAWPAGGPAMTFNGTTSAIEIGHQPMILAAAPMTVVAIVQTTTIAAGTPRFVHMGSDTGAGGWQFGRSGAVLSFTKYQGPSVILGTGTTNLTANSWYFVSAAIDRGLTGVRFGRRLLSLGGAFATQTVANTGTFNNPATRSIVLGAGRATTVLANFWSGSIGLVAVWNDRELTDGELQGLSYDPYVLVRPSGWVVLAQAPPAGGDVEVDLAASPATATTSAIAPSVVRGSLALDLSASPALATSIAVAPTVVTGFPSITVDLSGAPASATTSAIAPSLVAGSLTLTPAAATATTSAIPPSLVAGSLALAPAVAIATTSVVAPSVVIAGGGTSVDLSSLPAVATAAAVAPSVVQGSVSLAPAVATSTATATAPTVVRGSISLDMAPAVASAATSAIAPSLVLGSVTANLATLPATATTSAVAPTVDAGTGISVNLSGLPATATTTALAPSVVQSSVSVAPGVADATTLAVSPSVVLGSVTIALAASPATATTSALSPTVITAFAIVLPVRSTSVIASAPESLSGLVVLASTSVVVAAPMSHAEPAGAPTSSSSRGGPSSTATLV